MSVLKKDDVFFEGILRKCATKKIYRKSKRAPFSKLIPRVWKLL